jgi:uncharacterized protein YjiS (DUF1127 family)
MNFTNISEAWREFTRRRESRVAQRRTMLAISELPPHLLKDIGWPGEWETRRGRR